MLNYNRCEIAKRGKGVKDEFFVANLLGKQLEGSREVVYDHITPDSYDAILSKIDSLEDKHKILAEALDSYLAEQAKLASNPVMTFAVRILKDGILTKDSDKARQIAQSLVSTAKQASLDLEIFYLGACAQVKGK